MCKFQQKKAHNNEFWPFYSIFLYVSFVFQTKKAEKNDKSLYIDINHDIVVNYQQYCGLISSINMMKEVENITIFIN